MAKEKENNKVALERQTRVLLENMSSDIKKIAEGHSTLVHKLEQHDKRFDAVDKRFGMLELAISENGKAIKQNREVIKQNREAIDQNGASLKNLETATSEDTKYIKQIDKKLDTVLTNHEERLKKLEVVR